MMTIASAGLAYAFKSDARRIYLPGPTTAGHHQIELECGACHTRAFSDRESFQEACVRCHADELEAADDSHPERKFTDPRNADRVARLDARYCVTCHREHRPEITSSMGLSLPADYCYRCHQTVAEERPSHAGMAFETCAAAGCHNFHDNRALYEDFLVRHLDDAPQLSPQRNPARSARESRGPLLGKDADAHSSLKRTQAALEQWEASAHARGGVNCSGCHGGAAAEPAWRDAVSSERCGTCHEAEKTAFDRSRHGMKAANGLGAMRVGDARLAMQPSARDRIVGCTSCHGEHGFDTRRAAVDACLECHADSHSRAYRSSRHAALWAQDPSGESGASCATCHLPRLREGERVHVHHNQNDTLRPNEKMARPVCMSCHGLDFTLAALADTALIERNFAGAPAARSPSVALVRQRLSARGAARPDESKENRR
jgi:hypothetical protein